jgi:hypothetical protein
MTMEDGRRWDEELDMVDEADQPDSNEMLLYSYLSSIGKRKHNIGLNIRAGDTVFQFARETNYSETSKRKNSRNWLRISFIRFMVKIPSKDQLQLFCKK